MATSNAKHKKRTPKRAGRRRKNSSSKKPGATADSLTHNPTKFYTLDEWERLFPATTPAPTDEDEADAPEIHNTPSNRKIVHIERFTDVELGAAFGQLISDRLKHCTKYRLWFFWDGTRWASDGVMHAYSYAKFFTKQLLKHGFEIEDDDWRSKFIKLSLKCQSKYRIQAMVDMAQSEPGATVEPAELDQNPWLFNVHNVTIDLRTGLPQDHDPVDMITKTAPVTYDPMADCPRWLSFLNDIMNGDDEMVQYLQRCVGYSLIGDLIEHVLFVLFGKGGNGKTTFLETLHALFGDYASSTSSQTLLKASNSNPRQADPGLAALVGSRFVHAVELNEGHELNEAFIKSVTGGDTITTRDLYKSTFQFRPTFKVFFGVNHKPRVRENTHAIWRRLRLVPFDVQIAAANQDGNLPEKLKAELSGILNWAIQGCLEFQRQGLNPPTKVLLATETYRTEENILGAFLEDCCELDPMASEPFGKLYERYLGWCAENQEKPLAGRAFGDALTDQGIGATRTMQARTRAGIRLKVDDA